VSNDRRHPHHVSQTKAAPANPSGRLSPTLLTKPPTYQVLKLAFRTRCAELHWDRSSHGMSSASCLTVVSNFPAATFDRCRILRGARPYAVACVAISSRWRPDSVGWFVPRSPAAAQYLWPAGRARRAIPEGAGPLRLL